MSLTDATIVFQPGAPVQAQTTVTQNTANVFTSGVNVATIGAKDTLTVGTTNFFDVKVTLSDANATFTSSGFSGLVSGVSQSATITVTGSDTSTTIYKFNLTRNAAPPAPSGGGDVLPSANANASFASNGTSISDNGSISVTADTIDITITPARLPITIGLPPSQLTIPGATYTVTNGGSTSSSYTGVQTVTLSGLTNGSNTVTVLVTSSNTLVTRTYTFTVNATIASSGPTASPLDADNADANGVIYTLDSPSAGLATATGKLSSFTATEVVIPSAVTKEGITYNVVSIAGAFNGASTLTSVTIPSSVTSLGQSAFEGCGNLVTVNGANGLTSIGVSAFNNCGSLTSTPIGPLVTSIGVSAFNNCGSLTSTPIGPLVTSIDSYAFAGCHQFLSLVMPASVASIGGGSFFNCGGMTSLTISDSLVSIGSNAFDSCNALTTLTVGDNFSDASLIASLQSLTTLNLGSGNTHFVVDSGAIYQKIGDNLALIKLPPAISEFIIPEDVNDVPVTSIGNNAVKNRNTLTSVTIPLSVTSLGQSAFEGCGNLVTVNGANGLTYIGTSAFNNCGSLTSTPIGPLVTFIDSYAFASSGLVSLDIPASVTSIGSMSFYWLQSLTALTIRDSLVSIGWEAFGSTWNLTTLTVGNNFSDVSFLTSRANLTTLNLGSGNTHFVVDSGAIYHKNGGNLSLIKTPLTMSEFTIPAAVNSVPVTSIANNAFKERTTLTSVIIPPSVTSIGGDAFRNSGLISVVIPDSVTSIDNFVFAFCNGLTSVTIGSGVTNIGLDAFFCSNNILSFPVSLNNTVLCNDPSDNGVIYKIETNYAIVYKVIPTKVSYEILNVIKQQSVTSVRDKAFRGCDKLVSVTIPDSVTSIGDEGFNDCTVMSNVVIGSGVTRIGSQAFQNASALTYVTIPASVTSIGSHAFVGCSTLTSVIFLGNNVTTDNKDFFENNQFLNLHNTAICYYVNNKTGWEPYLSQVLPSGFSDIELYVVYFSGMTHNSGTLIVPANSQVGTVNGGTVSLGSGSIITLLSGGTVDVNTSGLRTITNTQNSFTLNLTSGTVNVETLYGISTAVVAISANRSLKVERGAFSGTISGAGTLSKTTPGTLTIDGTNSGFSGDIQVTEGTLKALAAASLGSGSIELGAGVLNNSANVTLQIESTTLNEIVSNQINCLSTGNNDIYNASAGSLKLNGGLAKNGTKARLLGNIEVRSNITGSTANSDIYIGNGDDVSGNVTFATGNTYDFNGPTIVTSGSTLTLEDNVQLANSDVTIKTGATLVLQYDTLGFKMKSLTMESGSYLVVSADLSANTYTLIDCSAASTLSPTVTVTYGGSLTATVSVANSQDIQLIVVDATATPSSNICFPAKTPVITNQGPVNIEDINPKIHTIRNKKIVAITKTVAHDKNLVRIAKHALGHLYPEKTTTMSQNHKVFFQGQMVKAKHLVDESNGVTLVPYKGEILYNVLLEQHEKMQVNNLIVETLHPEHKVAKLYRFLNNVDAAHHGKLIALFNKKDKEHRKSTL